jgi:hypothetical protein
MACLRLIRASHRSPGRARAAGVFFSRLVGPVIVVVLRVFGQDVPKVLFAVDQQVVEALAT